MPGLAPPRSGPSSLGRGPLGPWAPESPGPSPAPHSLAANLCGRTFSVMDCSEDLPRGARGAGMEDGVPHEVREAPSPWASASSFVK